MGFCWVWRGTICWLMVTTERYKNYGWCALAQKEYLEPVRRFFECETLLQVAAVAGVGDSDSVSVVFENRKIPERPNQSRFLFLGWTVSNDDKALQHVGSVTVSWFTLYCICTHICLIYYGPWWLPETSHSSLCHCWDYYSAFYKGELAPVCLAIR